jgi:quercetin dioxygenase-like cupin family protein
MHLVGFSLLLLIAAPPAWSQAPSRPCPLAAVDAHEPGPACLLAKQELGKLSPERVFWHLDVYPSSASAQAERTANGTVVQSFGKIWLFTIDGEAWRPPTGQHVASIGPLEIQPAPAFAAEYLRSIFTPGMSAPVHMHSGPEAFYSLSGDTCLETPQGVTVEKGAGNIVMVRGGPPMLLMAVGTETREAFALILHDSSRPPTTMVQDWSPKGLCKLALPSAAS